MKTLRNEDIMQKSIADRIITESILVLGLAETAHLTALFLHLSFGTCSLIFALLVLTRILAGACRYFFLHNKREKGTKIPCLWQQYPLWTAVTGALILFQIIWNSQMHIPYTAGDMTGETVQTMLATDTIYQINPFTGKEFLTGMPMRLKVLMLPTLYACICRWTGLSAITVCYSVMPVCVLLLSYLVYGRWAAYLFPEEGKKQILFVLFVALIYQFGAYSTVTDSFLLFFEGSQGEALRTCVLLPYGFLCTLKKDWRRTVLCILAEVCVVWTFYGLGFTVLTVGVVCMVRLAKKVYDGRKKV